MTDDKLPIWREVETAFAEQETWRSHWDDVFELVVPHRSKRYKESRGDKVAPYIYDSTAALAAERLANQMVSVLTPAGVPWLMLTPGPKWQGDDRLALARMLQPINRTLWYYVDQSALSVSLQPVLTDMTVTAGCIKIEPADSGIGVRTEAVPIDEVAYRRGRAGIVDFVYHKRWVAGHDILQTWGDAVPERQHEVISRAPNEKFVVISACVPSGSRFRYYDLLEMDHVVLVDKTLKRNPYKILRWSETSSSQYSRGPGMVAYPDILNLNTMAEYQLKAAAFDLLGIWLVEDDGVLNPHTIDLVPGARIAVGNTSLAQPAIRRADDSGQARNRIGQDVINDRREAVLRAFYADKFSPIEGTKMSAAEILERAKELSDTLGAVWGRIESEGLRPIAADYVDILREQGAFSDLGDEVTQLLRVDRQDLDVVFLGTLAQAQRLQTAQGIIQYATVASQLGAADPEAALVVDMAMALRQVAEMMGVPADMIKTNDEIAEITQAAAPMVDQAMMAEMGGAGGAGPTPAL